MSDGTVVGEGDPEAPDYLDRLREGMAAVPETRKAA